MLKRKNGLIIVLGSPNSNKGELYNIAKERCDLAFWEYKQRPGWKFLLTGGFGEHFNNTIVPHAEYLNSYLIKKGVPEFDFVEFAESTSTIEDALLSKNIVMNHNVHEILIVTSDFHYERASYIFNREYADIEMRISYAASKTNRELCGIDLESQIKHERESLIKMKLRNGLQ